MQIWQVILRAGSGLQGVEQTPRPTAFVAGAMMTAQGVYRAATQMGLTIGKDVTVGGKSKTWTVLAFYPKALTGG